MHKHSTENMLILSRGESVSEFGSLMFEARRNFSVTVHQILILQREVLENIQILYNQSLHKIKEGS